MARKSGKDKGIFEKPPGSGIWYVRWTDEFGKDHKRKIGSKTQARDVYQKIRSSIVEGTYLPEKLERKRRALLKDAIQAYLTESKATKRSLKDDARYGAVWIAELGNMALEDVRPADVEAWRRQKSLEAAPATVNRHHAFLKRVFNVAIRDGRCRDNPAARVKLLRENNARLRFLNREEERRLRRAFPADKWHMVELALMTGLRLSEQLNLRWEWVDFVACVITIPRSKHGEKRHVSMNSRVVEILRGLPSRMKSPWVYPGRAADRPASFGTVRKDFERALKEAEIEGFTWHSLRHTFASRLVMAGKSLSAVRELMGHKTIVMTQRYAHLAPGHLAEAVECLIAVPDDDQLNSSQSEQKRNQPEQASTETA